MDLRSRARKVGKSVILCALVLRLYCDGAFRKAVDFLIRPDVIPFLIYLETGRDVRFSPSLEMFSPKFVESSPPMRPKTEEPTEPALPVFSGSEEVQLYYGCKVSPDIQSLMQKPLNWNLKEDPPSVLILSTHATESYTRKDEPYQEVSSWRTLSEEYNMLSIGHRVGQLLEEAGIGVIRDTQLHDYPSYNGSYVHARKSIQEILEENPSIRVVLDLHRDASAGEAGQVRTLAKVDGDASAQLMLVLGTNHENYEENLSFALKLQGYLDKTYPGIMRPLQLRAQRFNQDLSPGAILVEVGAAGNSHGEAMLAAEKLAEGIIALSAGTA